MATVISRRQLGSPYQGSQWRSLHIFNTLELIFTLVQVCHVRGVDPLNVIVRGVFTLLHFVQWVSLTSGNSFPVLCALVVSREPNMHKFTPVRHSVGETFTHCCHTIHFQALWSFHPENDNIRCHKKKLKIKILFTGRFTAWFPFVTTLASTQYKAKLHYSTSHILHFTGCEKLGA